MRDICFGMRISILRSCSRGDLRNGDRVGFEKCADAEVHRENNGNLVKSNSIEKKNRRQVHSEYAIQSGKTNLSARIAGRIRGEYQKDINQHYAIAY